MMDIDHFKSINDTYGHLAGDEALRRTAGRITSALRPYDAVGRYGGEEFLVVMPGCDTTDALIVAERLRALFDENPIVSPEGTLHVRLSLGAVVIKGKNRLNTDSVVKAADESLYRAKNLGRNRVEFSGEF